MSSVEEYMKKMAAKTDAELAFKDLAAIYALWIPMVLFNGWYFKTILNWFIPTLMPGAVISYAWCLAALLICGAVHSHFAMNNVSKEVKKGEQLQRLIAMMVFKLSFLVVAFFIHLWFF